jgi:phage terminase large subunit-like protein
VAVSSSVRADAVECLSNLERQDAGLPALGVGGHAFVLDAHSAVMNPAEWGALAVRLYQTYGADRIVAETNFGADMVELTIRTVRDADDKPIGVNVPFKALNAARGKAAREEPAAALYE